MQSAPGAHTIWDEMAKTKEKIFEVACPDCGAMLRIDGATGLVVSHTPAPRKRMFEDLETAAQAMRDQDERKESIFRQSVEAEKNKEDLFEKKFAEAIAQGQGCSRRQADAGFRPGLNAALHSEVLYFTYPR